MTSIHFDSLAPFIYGPGLFFLYTIFTSISIQLYPFLLLYIRLYIYHHNHHIIFFARFKAIFTCRQYSRHIADEPTCWS